MAVGETQQPSRREARSVRAKVNKRPVTSVKRRATSLHEPGAAVLVVQVSGYWWSLLLNRFSAVGYVRRRGGGTLTAARKHIGRIIMEEMEHEGDAAGGAGAGGKG